MTLTLLKPSPDELHPLKDRWDDAEMKQILGVFEDVLDRALKARGFRRPVQGPALRTRRYRDRLRAAKGSHSGDQWMARVEFYGWKCGYCGLRLTTKTLVKDHAIPLNKGGTNWPANLIPACKPCNSRKRDQTPLEDGWRFS